MTHLFIFLNLKEIGAGGLFDFGATLPLLMVQFAILNFVLDLILYSPILKTINNRNEYIISNLTQATDLLATADTIANQYSSDLQKKRKELQLDLSTSEKVYKEIWNFELELIQKECDSYVTKYNNYLSNEKVKAVSILENNLKNPSDPIFKQIIKKLLLQA